MTEIVNGMLIRTTRLLLRPMSVEDAGLVVSWRNQPQNAELFLSPPPTYEQHLKWFTSDRSNRVDYVISMADSAEVVGTLNYVLLGPGKGAETGTLIGSIPHRGRGIASEAKIAWTLFGFAALAIDSIFVRIRSDNKQMIRIDKGLGYQYVSTEDMANALGVIHPYLKLRLDKNKVLDLPRYRTEDHHRFLEAIRLHQIRAGG